MSASSVSTSIDVPAASHRGRRDRAARLLSLPGMRRVARLLPRWKGVLVLNYHRIGESSGQPWDHTLWSANEAAFDAQLAVLARDAEVISPGDIEAARRNGRAGRRVLLTFDDGYRDNYEIAFPLLRKHRLPATFFLATGFVDQRRVAWWDEIAWMVRNAGVQSLEAGSWHPTELPLRGPQQAATIATLVGIYKALPSERTDAFLEHVGTVTGSGRCPEAAADGLWMTWEMARELRDAGMGIGGHTVSHPVLARLSPAEQEDEIARCRQALREHLDQPMTWFSYPVGARDSFGPETQRLVREHGVELAFSFYGGFGRFDRWNSLDVPRVHVGPHYGRELLGAQLLLPRLFTGW